MLRILQKKPKNTMQYDLASNYNAVETDLDFLFKILDAGFVVFGFLELAPCILQNPANSYYLNDIKFSSKSELIQFIQVRDLRYIKPLNLPAWVEND